MIVNYMKDTAIILAGLTAIAGIIYWAIKAKLRDDFCEKVECVKKHEKLDQVILNQRSDLSNDIREIKEVVLRIEERFFRWIEKQTG